MWAWHLPNRGPFSGKRLAGSAFRVTRKVTAYRPAAEERQSAPKADSQGSKASAGTSTYRGRHMDILTGK